MADIKPTYTGSEKLVTSDILYQNMKNFDARREQKVHDLLYVEIPEIEAHYEEAQNSDPGALEIIDDSSSVIGNQIKISDVTPVKDGYVPSIGGYTVLIPLVPASEKEKYLKQTDLDVENELLDLNEFDNVAP